MPELENRFKVLRCVFDLRIFYFYHSIAALFKTFKLLNRVIYQCLYNLLMVENASKVDWEISLGVWRERGSPTF